MIFTSVCLCLTLVFGSLVPFFGLGALIAFSFAATLTVIGGICTAGTHDIDDPVTHVSVERRSQPKVVIVEQPQPVRYSFWHNFWHRGGAGIDGACRPVRNVYVSPQPAPRKIGNQPRPVAGVGGHGGWHRGGAGVVAQPMPRMGGQQPRPIYR